MDAITFLLAFGLVVIIPTVIGIAIRALAGSDGDTTSLPALFEPVVGPTLARAGQPG